MQIINSDFKLVSKSNDSIASLTKDEVKDIIKVEFNKLIENKNMDFAIEYNLRNPFCIIKFSNKGEKV